MALKLSNLEKHEFVDLVLKNKENIDVEKVITNFQKESLIDLKDFVSSEIASILLDSKLKYLIPIFFSVLFLDLSFYFLKFISAFSTVNVFLALFICQVYLLSESVHLNYFKRKYFKKNMEAKNKFDKYVQFIKLYETFSKEQKSFESFKLENNLK